MEEIKKYKGSVPMAGGLYPASGGEYPLINTALIEKDSVSGQRLDKYLEEYPYPFIYIGVATNKEALDSLLPETEDSDNRSFIAFNKGEQVYYARSPITKEWTVCSASINEIVNSVEGASLIGIGDDVNEFIDISSIKAYINTGEENNEYQLIEKQDLMSDDTFSKEEKNKIKSALGVIGIEDIAQELGDSEKMVLSQKIATDNFRRFATYNLLDDLEIEKDKCLTTSDGIPQTNGNGWAVTGHIPVEGGKTYYFNFWNVIQGYNYAYLADGSVVSIPRSAMTFITNNYGSFVAPENAKSVRFSFQYTNTTNLLMYEDDGGELKPYVPFLAVSSDTLLHEAVTTEKIKDNAVTKEKIDVDFVEAQSTENILFTDLLQQGNINYLTGKEMDSEANVRTDFIKLNDNISYVLSAFSTVARCYVIYYDKGKKYLGYNVKNPENGSYVTKLTVNTADFVGARYIRMRFETNNATSVTLETMYPVQLEEGTDIGHFVAANRAFKYIEEYEQLAKSKIFYNGDYDDFARLISSAVKEIYVPDNTYKGTLTFSKLIKETGNAGSISFYTTVDTGETLVYRSAPLTNTSGVKTIEIPNYISGEPAYIVIDWDKIPDGTNITGKNRHPHILADGVYDIENAPTIKAKLFADKNTIFFDNAYNEKTSLISSAVLALYVGDSTYKGNLRFCVLRKLYGVGGIIRFYAYIGNTLTQVYETDRQNDLTGVKIIEMQNLLGGEPAYIVVDWDKVPDGTSLTGNTGSEMILNDKVYEEAALSEIQMAMAEKSTERNLDAKGNLNIFADKFRGGEVETNLLKFHRNFNIPKKGLFFSTDAEYYKALDGNTTDEERIKGLIPYLYFNGKKIGTIVLYDETTGAPFIYLEDGTKKILS